MTTRRSLRGGTAARRKSQRQEQKRQVLVEYECYEDENGPIAKGGVACPFPWRLHEMLAYVEESNYEHIIRWDEGGASFSVYKVDDFVKIILPLFFSQTKFASFQRQLNLYGFNRRRSRKNSGFSCYFHKHFVKGRRELVRNMVRRKIKGTGRKRTASVDESSTTETELTVNHDAFYMYDSTEETLDDMTAVDPQGFSIGSIDVNVGASYPTTTAATTTTTTTTTTLPSLDSMPPTPVTPLSLSRNSYNAGLGNTVVDMFNDGDLLFFEGSPFHYLEPEPEPEQVPNPTSTSTIESGPLFPSFASSGSNPFLKLKPRRDQFATAATSTAAIVWPDVAPLAL